MAQAGYTPISLYYSTTTTNVPTNTNLVNGELAINITDGKLFYKDNLGVVQLIASKAGASGDVVGPASATDNAIVRFDGTTGKLVQNSVVTIADTTGNMAGVGTLSSGAITSSSLTSGRVLYAGVSGLIQDSANLTFDGSNLQIGAQGDLRFADSDSSNWVAFQAAATIASNITWTLPNADGSNGQVLTTNGTGTLTWTTAATNITISNDTSTSSNVYPVFVSATTGTASTLNTSDAKLLYKPSTGEFQATVPVAGNGIFVNTNTVAADYTIAAGYNGLSGGPVTVNSGITVTITSGSVWTIT